MNENAGDSDGRGPPEGRYANVFQVGHNAFEFVIDFGQANLPDSGSRYHTRIITGPAYAKVLYAVLRESVERYEAAFGTIPDGADQDN
jgi:hypothetical protein